jgi:type II secretory ATPase GspE/PulE/Tfp pilus assembly ATPase PilB-like protein
MTEMGIEPYLQCSSIIGVVAQRLMRKVCESCMTEFLPPADLLQRIRWKGENKSFVTGQGCDKCFDTGLRGRTGIYELLTVNEKMRRAILENPSADNVRKTALQNGMQTLADSAFKVVERHETTLEEALRIVYVEDEADEIIAATSAEAVGA